VDLGHRRIAIVSGPQHLSNARDRLEGFRKTLRAARISIPKNYIEFGDFREASGYQAAERLLSLPHRPTAIFVANNEMMAGTLSAVRQRKVKVPRELSLVGFDDARWAQYLEPPLTVVSQPAELMGQKAAQLLLTRLNGRATAQTIVFTPELIVRRSAAAPKS
jgi:LacI family transcriptional regulator